MHIDPMKFWVGLILLFCNSSFAYTIMKVQGKSVLVNTEKSNGKPLVGAQFQILNEVGNLKGVLKLIKIQDKQAVAEVVEGFATADMTLVPIGQVEEKPPDELNLDDELEELYTPMYVIKTNGDRALIQLSKSTPVSVGDTLRVASNAVWARVKVLKINDGAKDALVEIIEGELKENVELELESASTPADDNTYSAFYTQHSTVNHKTKYGLSLGLGSGVGYASRDLTFSYDKNYGTIESLTYTGFSLGYSASENKSTDANDNEIQLKATSLDFSNSWSFNNNWSTSLGLSKSETRQVNYSTTGLNISIQKFSGNTDTEIFEPFITSRFSIGASDIQQDISLTPNGQKFAYKITQTTYALSLYWQPIESTGLSFSMSRYVYNKPKRDLQLAAQSPTLNRRASDLVSTLFDLLGSSASLGWNYSLDESWNFSLDLEQSYSLIDTSTINSTSYGINYTLTSDIDTAVTATQSAVDGEKDWSYAFNVGYSF